MMTWHVLMHKILCRAKCLTPAALCAAQVYYERRCVAFYDAKWFQVQRLDGQVGECQGALAQGSAVGARRDVVDDAGPAFRCWHAVGRRCAAATALAHKPSL